MKRMFAVGLLALPALLLAGPAARAQDCYGGGAGGPGCAGGGVGGPAPSGGRSCHFCFRLFGTGFFQEGPLFNYGPYAGYYPFAPYGPWGSDMSYSGAGAGGCGAGGCGAGSMCGWNHNLFGRHGRGGNCGAGGAGGGHGLGHGGLGGGFGHSDCGAGGCGNSGGAWGQYAMTTMRGVFHRSHPLGHRAKLTTGSVAEPASGCAGGCGTSAGSGSSIQSVSGESVGDPAATGRGFRER